MKKWNYIISTVALALGVWVIYLAAQLPAESSGDPGSGFWPRMLGVILLGLAVVLAVSNTVKGKKEAAKEIALTLPANMRVYVFMAAITVYCVILYFLGFVIASLLFIPCAMYLLGVRDKKLMLLVDILVIAAIFIVFRVLLKSPLPSPIFLR